MSVVNRFEFGVRVSIKQPMGGVVKFTWSRVKVHLMRRHIVILSLDRS